jgi:hypothetical protein
MAKRIMSGKPPSVAAFFTQSRVTRNFPNPLTS